MALSDNDSKILQEIVDIDGSCMSSERCKKCPFRAMCLPEFLNPQPPTPNQRAQMALDVLAHHALVDEELEIQEYHWNKK